MNSMFLTTAFACMSLIAQSTSGQDCMNVLTKDHQVHHFNVSDVNQISFETNGEITVCTGNAIIDSPTSASVITRVAFTKEGSNQPIGRHILWKFHREDGTDKGQHHGGWSGMEGDTQQPASHKSYQETQTSLSMTCKVSYTIHPRVASIS